VKLLYFLCASLCSAFSQKGELMKIKANDSEAEAHLAVAHPAEKGPGVLVLHPWWGLNEDIKQVANRLAEAGFVALAPDLYDGRIATTIPEDAETFAGQHGLGQSGSNCAGRLRQQLLAHDACQGDQIGVIGFSLGAGFAVWLAHAQQESVAAVVLFYGLGWTRRDQHPGQLSGPFCGQRSV
jgi:carboxymethylenebutenolidase